MATAATAKYVIRVENKTKRAFKAIGRSLNKIRKAVFSMKAEQEKQETGKYLFTMLKKHLELEMTKQGRAHFNFYLSISSELKKLIKHIN